MPITRGTRASIYYRMDTNKWTHVAASYNGSKGEIYKNGDSKSRKSFTTTIDNKNKMYLGALRGGSNPDRYDGAMDYWEIHNKKN